MLPNALVIGAERCGTTSLHRYLSLHPQIAMSRTKELRFFADRPSLESGPPVSPGFDRAIVERMSGEWKRGLAWYEAQFDAAPVRGESSPVYSNAWFGYCADRIRELIPAARLIFCVREPVDRAVSHYQLVRAYGTDPRPMDEALSVEHGIYATGSRYALRLEPYLAAFPAERILIVDSAELERDRRRTLRSVFRFLGVDDGYWSAQLERRWHVGERQHGLAWRALARLRLLPGWPRIATLPPRRALWAIEALTGSRRPAARPSPVVREQLASWLAEDAERLRALTGRRFPSWSV
jgi:hypothetical protein